MTKRQIQDLLAHHTEQEVAEMLRKHWGMSRRSFLKGMAATSAALGLGSFMTGCDGGGGENPPPWEDHTTVTATAPAAQTTIAALGFGENTEEFAFGVRSGEVTHERAMVWCFSESKDPKKLQVWKPVSGNQGVLVLDTDITPTTRGYYRVVVENLEPYTEYRFAFYSPTGSPDVVGRSRVGRFLTAPRLNDSPSLTIAGSTCTNISEAPFDALGLMAAAKADLFVHLGDMSYNDGAVTLDEYTDIWNQTLSEPNYLDIFASTSLMMTWDDHELDDNWDPEQTSDEQKAAAFYAFWEQMPIIRFTEPGKEDRLWRKFRWGRTAEFFVLDSRSERQPSTLISNNPIYLGQEQFDWLKAELLASPCQFKIILNSVPAAQLSPLWLPLIDDRWTAYAAQREELLDHIDQYMIEDVYFLSGDFHVGFVAAMEPGSGRMRNKTYEIAVGPGGNLNQAIKPIAARQDSNGNWSYDPNGFNAVFQPANFLFGSVFKAASLLTFNPVKRMVTLRNTEPENNNRQIVVHTRQA